MHLRVLFEDVPQYFRTVDLEMRAFVRGTKEIYEIVCVARAIFSDFHMVWPWTSKLIAMEFSATKALEVRKQNPP